MLDVNNCLYILSSAITCTALSNPTDGTAPTCTPDSTAHGSSCTFTCNSGFALSHSNALTCQDGTGTSGEWSESPPTCDGE